MQLYIHVHVHVYFTCMNNCIIRRSKTNSWGEGGGKPVPMGANILLDPMIGVCFLVRDYLCVVCGRSYSNYASHSVIGSFTQGIVQ